MRVSVIVPSYNKALYLRRALDSIASQTLADFEVIVVDDGSSDGSTELAAAYPDPASAPSSKRMPGRALRGTAASPKLAVQ